MAKEPLSKKTSIRVTIGLLVTVGLAIAATSAGLVTHNSKIEAIGLKTNTMKVEGCNPAKEMILDMAVVKIEVAAIKEDVREMRVEQKTNTAAIIKAINDKE